MENVGPKRGDEIEPVVDQNTVLLYYSSSTTTGSTAQGDTLVQTTYEYVHRASAIRYDTRHMYVAVY